jgi:selenocysteine lyase/cysteine desulfurase
MPNYPAIYTIRAGLDYIARQGVETIDRVSRPLMQNCLDGLRRLPVELLTPGNAADLAGIVAFRHPAMESIQHHLRAHNIHVMAQAGRMRIAIHGYNTADDIDRLLDTLKQALDHVQA